MKVGISVEKEEKEILFVKEGKEIFVEGSVYLGRKGGKKTTIFISNWLGMSFSGWGQREKLGNW